MEIREILAHNLKTQRRARGLSQEELAHRAGIDRTYISSLERSVDSLAKVLGVEASDLLKRPGPSAKRRGSSARGGVT